VTELAEEIDLAPVTVRYHLTLLRRQGLVDVQTEPVGRGRPRHVFHLTPGGYDALGAPERSGLEAVVSRLIGALDAVRDGDGDDAAEAVFRQLALEATAEAAESLHGQPMDVRLNAVTSVLAEQGFVVRWEAEGEDYLVREVACPFRNLHGEHNVVCVLDAEMIQHLVDGEVTRDRWRVKGDSACVYRVRPSRGSNGLDAGDPDEQSARGGPDHAAESTPRGGAPGSTGRG